VKGIDLLGQRFGRLVVVEFAGKARNGKRTWRCLCDCGQEVVARADTLRVRHTRSCGCLVKESAHERFTRHGHARDGNTSPEYRCWQGMHDRCYNVNNPSFARYGGRGITVCWRWHRNNPDGFVNFVADMGLRPLGMSIDRIDNDGNYDPGNCRWATPKQQNNNCRHPLGVTGIRGVMPTRNGKKFKALISRDDGRNVYLGTFATIDEAATAYQQARAARANG
jgi:hypothetical protein